MPALAEGQLSLWKPLQSATRPKLDAQGMEEQAIASRQSRKVGQYRPELPNFQGVFQKLEGQAPAIPEHDLEDQNAEKGTGQAL